MASLLTTIQSLITIGGEDKRIDVLEAELTGCTEIVADVTRYLVENAVTTYATLWQDSQHATAVNPLAETFKKAIIVVDPSLANASVLPCDIEIASTQHNSTTIDLRVFRIDRTAPFIIGSISSGASQTDNGGLFAAIISGGTNYNRITRIRARNPSTLSAGATHLTVRALLVR